MTQQSPLPSNENLGRKNRREWEIYTKLGRLGV